MARTKKNRLIQMAPGFNGFKPEGLQRNPEKEVVIGFDEYEALNLCDYELLTQAEAAKLMNVSRPTFTRTYERVRRKIASAFMEGCPIRFEGGGHVVSGWFKCEQCQISFTLDDESSGECPFCRKGPVKAIN